MTIYDTRTQLSGPDVIERAEAFFTRAFSPAAAFVQARTDRYLRLHQEVGEVVIAALPERGCTHVRASASRSSQLLAHFIASLAPAHDAVQTVNRHAEQRTFATVVEGVALPAAEPAEAA